MHNGCDIANQMLPKGQLWTWPLIFKICWTRLLSLVVYMVIIVIFFPGMLNSRSILLQSEQSGDWHQMQTTGLREQDSRCDEEIKTSGALWIDTYLQAVITSQNDDLQALQILHNLDIASHLWHVVWICPGNGLVPIRQQAFNKTHDDKHKACHLVHHATIITSRKPDEKCIGQKGVAWV